MVNGPRTIATFSPKGRIANELRLGESGNGWLDAQCGVGTGEAGHSRLLFFQWHRQNKRGRGVWHEKSNNVARLTGRARLAIGTIKAGKLPDACMIQAVAHGAGRSKFDSLRMGVRCCFFHVMVRARSVSHRALTKHRGRQHLSRHSVPHQAAQRQQEDHDKDKKAAHRRIITADLYLQCLNG